MCLASVAWFLEWTPVTENAILVCREKIVAEVIGECAGSDVHMHGSRLVTCSGAALLHSTASTTLCCGDINGGLLARLMATPEPLLASIRGVFSGSPGSISDGLGRAAAEP
jgi:hypothetical protein